MLNLSVVKGRNVHYSEPDAGESYFKAVLSNTKEKLKLFQKGNSFKVKNMQRQILRRQHGNMNI